MFSTIVISGILIVLVTLIIKKLVKDGKSGGGCSENCGSCGDCPHSGQCRR